MVVSAVLSLKKELGLDQTVAGSDDCPVAYLQDVGGGFFRRVTSASLSVVTVDQKARELFLGAIQPFGHAYMLEGEQVILWLKRHRLRSPALGSRRTVPLTNASAINQKMIGCVSEVKWKGK